jgi:hypothetical protein
MVMRTDPRNTRSALSKWVHVFERSGLALAGGSRGVVRNDKQASC